MSNNFRVHVSLLLLAVLSSVLLFAFRAAERGEILYIAAALFAFGETALLLDRLYEKLSSHTR